eukprot:6129100-Amphidinium_carterae.1
MGVQTVWTDGSGRHSSNPHYRRCGVGYVTDRQSVFRAELLALVRALEECNVDEGRITLENLQGNQEVDKVANIGIAAHAPHEPIAEYLRWKLAAQAVRVFWLSVAPKLRNRPEAWPRFCRRSLALRPLV